MRSFQQWCQHLVLTMSLTYWLPVTYGTQNFFHFHLPTQIHIIIIIWRLDDDEEGKYFSLLRISIINHLLWEGERERGDWRGEGGILACEAVKIYFDWWDITYENEREDEGSWKFSRTFYFSSCSYSLSSVRLVEEDFFLSQIDSVRLFRRKD